MKITKTPQENHIKTIGITFVATIFLFLHSLGYICQAKNYY